MQLGGVAPTVSPDPELMASHSEEERQPILNASADSPGRDPIWRTKKDSQTTVRSPFGLVRCQFLIAKGAAIAMQLFCFLSAEISCWRILGIRCP